MPTDRLSTNRPAGQRRGEAELGVDDRGGTVDVHRHRPQRGLDRERGAQVVAGHHPVPDGVVDHRKQRVAPRVDRVEAVPEARHVPRPGLPGGQHPGGGGFQGSSGLLSLDDLGEQPDELLAGPAVHVTEHADPGRHRRVEAHPAGRGHPGRGDGRRLRAVVDGRDQGRLEQRLLGGRRR